MKILRREFYNVSRGDVFSIIPLGDVHIGNAACDEELLDETIAEIKNRPNTYWIGLGDYCLSEDTEILTSEGWKGVRQMVKSPSEVVVYDKNKRECKLEKINKLWVNPVRDETLVNLKSGHVDALVTKNHKILTNYYDYKGGWNAYKDVKAKEFLDIDREFSWRVPVTPVSWVGKKPEISIDWVRLKAWIDTEGHEEQRGNYCRIEISQSIEANPKLVERIEALIERLNLTPYEHVRNWGIKTWRFNAKDTRRIHEHIGRKGERLDWLMNAPVEYLEVYFNVLMDGDGTWSRNTFAQKEKPLVDIFQELCFKLGYRAKVSFNDKMWKCYFGKKRGKHSLLRETNRVKYTGITWCVSTDTGYIVTKRNNKVTILGNCDYIQLGDWRNDPSMLADWISINDLNDISRAETNRFIRKVEPIADKCLALVQGNHEELIKRKYERDIYSEIVTGVKRKAGMRGEDHLGVGYYGWLRLVFYSDDGNHTRSAIDICLHHGFVGGKLSGAKALNMERYLWTHSADLILMGHSHNTLSMKATVEELDHMGNIRYHVRRGAFTGTFLSTTNEGGSSTYSERAGHLPTPVGTIEVVLRPGHSNPNKRVKVMT